MESIERNLKLERREKKIDIENIKYLFNIINIINFFI